MTEAIHTGAADETESNLRRWRQQLQDMRRALEQSMDSPEGMAWEDQIAAQEPEPLPEPESPRPKPLAERERRWREQFALNWFGRKKRR